MNPILIGALLFFGAKTMGKKKVTDETAPEGTETSSKPNLPGEPTLEVLKIHKFPIDKVDFKLEADGQEMKGDHKAKDQQPTSIKAGNYSLVAITDPKIRSGQKKPDVVMLVVQDKAGKKIIAKRILINDKKIIDII